MFILISTKVQLNTAIFQIMVLVWSHYAINAANAFYGKPQNILSIGSTTIMNLAEY